jgi:hypothetical protein
MSKNYIYIYIYTYMNLTLFILNNYEINAEWLSCMYISLSNSLHRCFYLFEGQDILLMTTDFLL